MAGTIDYTALRERLFHKDESHGFCEREDAIDAFLRTNPPEAQDERYVAALEFVLPRLSTPIEETDILLGRMVEGPIDYDMEFQPAGGKSHARNPFAVEGRNTGHMSLDFGPLLRKGLRGIVEEMRAAEGAETVGAAQTRFADLAERAVNAIEAFAHRYAAHARELGHHRAADALRRVPAYPATDLFTALQSVWFMEYVLSCIVGGRDFAYSRLDLELAAYYDAAVASGEDAASNAPASGEDAVSNAPASAEDAASNAPASAGNATLGAHRPASDSIPADLPAAPLSAADLLAAFLWMNNQHGGMNSELRGIMPVPCASTNTYLMLGGRGAESALALDLALLEAAKRVRLPQPVLALRVESASPKEWKIAAAAAAQVLDGQVSLYNDDALIPNLRGLGLLDDQALHYTMSGCNRAEFCGHQSSDVFHNCPAWLLEAFYDPGVRSMEDLLAAFSAVARRECLKRPGNPRFPADTDPRFHLESLLLRGCAQSGVDIENGGLESETMVHNLCGIATVADSLAAIQALVFDEGTLTWDAYRALVRGNFAADPELHARIRVKLPKYGNDNAKADVWAARAGEILARAVREMPDRIHIPSFYSLYFHQSMGEKLGTTPDGRLAGEAISENQSAVYGRDTQGATAMLHSAAALPQALCGAGGLNLRFARPLEDRLLAGLVDAYFAMGGVNLAPNIVSRETLLAARANPEQYASLCVRIVGYSEAFVRLPDAMQLELIARTESAL